jgi:transposase, IS5 family
LAVLSSNISFGMKVHIAVDADSGLAHHHVRTAATVHYQSVVGQLLPGSKKHVFADSGYRGIEKWTRQKPIRWSIALTLRKRKALDIRKPIDVLKHKLEYVKTTIRTKAEHSYRVIKRNFGCPKARYRRLANNAAQVATLFMRRSCGWRAKDFL